MGREETTVEIFQSETTIPERKKSMGRVFANTAISLMLLFGCAYFSFVPEQGITPSSGTETILPPHPGLTNSAVTFPALPTGMPMSVPSAVVPVAGYQLIEEILIDDYAVRLWTNAQNEFGFDDILVIEAPGTGSIRVDMVSAIHDLTAEDINADGFPEVVVETYSGGAHCCFGTQVFSLREGPVLLLKTPQSNAGGQFQDLNADDLQEFITYDDTFAYRYCPYAAGVGVKVILAYDPVRDLYLPASPQFPDHYEADIATNEQRASSLPGQLGEWDGSNMCAILPLALDYLYLAQPEKAWEEFSSRYSGPARDAETIWNEVLESALASPLYTP